MATRPRPWRRRLCRPAIRPHCFPPSGGQAANYDFSRDGDIVALPTDLGGARPARPLRRPVRRLRAQPGRRHDQDRRRRQGTRLAGRHPHRLHRRSRGRRLLSAYVVPADAVGATPTRISPATAFDEVDDLVWSRNSNSLLITGLFTEANNFEMILVDLGGKDPTPRTLDRSRRHSGHRRVARRHPAACSTGRQRDSPRGAWTRTTATSSTSSIRPGSDRPRSCRSPRSRAKTARPSPLAAPTFRPTATSSRSPPTQRAGDLRPVPHAVRWQRGAAAAHHRAHRRRAGHGQSD